MVSGIQLTRNTFLQRHPMLATLGEPASHRLVAEFVSFRRPPGEALFAMGDPPDGLYVIERGELVVTLTRGTSHRVMLAELSSGAVIGETGLVAAGARSATVEAITEVHGWWLPRRRFEALFADGDPGADRLLLHVARTVVERRRQTEKRLRALVDDPALRGQLTSRETLELVGTLLGT